MKEFDNPFQKMPDTYIDVNQRKNYSYIGSIRIKPGHNLFSVNIDTMEIKKVEIKRTNDIDIEGNVLNRTRTMLDPKLYYCSALNEKNALRKFNKQFNNK